MKNNKGISLIIIIFLLTFVSLLVFVFITVNKKTEKSNLNQNIEMPKRKELSEHLNRNETTEPVKEPSKQKSIKSCVSSEVWAYISCDKINTIKSKSELSTFQGGIGSTISNSKYQITILPGWRIEYSFSEYENTANIINTNNEDYVLSISQGERSGFECSYKDILETLPNFKKFSDFVEITDSDGVKYRRSNEGLYEDSLSGGNSSKPENVYIVCGYIEDYDYYSSSSKFGNINYTILTDMYNFDINSVDFGIISEMDKMVSSLEEI